MTDYVVEDLMEKYPDTIRHPLVVENADWDESIIPALSEFSVLAEKGLVGGIGFMRAMRFMLEVVYVMGYKLGKDEK